MTIRYVKEDDEGHWGVTKEGHRRPTASGATKADALRTARVHTQREGGGEIHVLNETGKVVETVTVPAPTA
jgi:hypothetical protein